MDRCIMCNKAKDLRNPDPFCDRCKAGAVISRDLQGRLIQLINIHGATFVVRWDEQGRPKMIQEDFLDFMEG